MSTPPTSQGHQPRVAGEGNHSSPPSEANETRADARASVPPESARTPSSATSAAASSPASHSSKKRKYESPELIKAYKNRVNACLEEEEAMAELEQAKKKLKQAEERVSAAASNVATALHELAVQKHEWGHHDAMWVSFYRELIQYQKKHGHTRVPRNEGPLGIWAARQRYCARGTGSGNVLSESRRQLLEDIGFEWGASEVMVRVPWNERYQELLEFKNKFGHCNATQRTEYHTLALWVAHQRRNYQSIKEGKSGGGLTEERIKLLEAAGVEWRRHKYKKRTKKTKQTEHASSQTSQV